MIHGAPEEPLAWPRTGRHRVGKERLRHHRMFRKKQDVAERSRSLLKNSAAKKIKAEIVAALPALTKDVIDELMPNKASVLAAHGAIAAALQRIAASIGIGQGLLEGRDQKCWSPLVHRRRLVNPRPPKMRHDSLLCC